MSNPYEQLGLVLAFLSSAGLFSLYVDVGEVVRAYCDADIVFQVMKAKFQLANMTFTPCRQGLGPSATASAQGEVGDGMATLIGLSPDIENSLAQFLNSAVVLDVETQMLMFSSRREKLKWAFGGRRRQLALKIDKYSELVDMLRRVIPTMSPVTMTPRCGFSTMDQQQTIWLRDFMGIDREFHLDMCRGAGGFILSLLLTLKPSKESIDADGQAALLNGDFWIIPEDQEQRQLESIPGGNTIQSPIDARQGAILADTWEDKVKPGHRYKLVMLTADSEVNPRLDSETLQGPWNSKIKPILPDILQLSGWNR